MNVKLDNRQKGLTMISWVIIIAFLAFQGMVALKIAPVYFNDATISSVLKGMESDPSLAGQPPKELVGLLIKRLKVNNVYSLNKEDVKVKKTRSHYILMITYEPRGNVVGSLDYIMTFNHEARIPTR